MSRPRLRFLVRPAHPAGPTSASRPRRSGAAAAFALSVTLLLPAAPALAGPLQAATRVLGPAGPAAYNAGTGGAVAPAGDVNGDGLADVLVSPVENGRVFVVLGTRTQKNLELPTGSGAAFEIGTSGRLVASPAGDVDGDGLADLLVRDNSSEKYIVYGGRDVRDIALPNASDPRVTLIKAPIGNAYTGFQRAGDFDGDGKGDILINRGPDVAIVRGGPRESTLDATGTGPRISKITGIQKCVWLYGVIYNCFTVTNDPVPIGDVNGDGKDDLFQPKNKFITLGRAGTGTILSTPDQQSVRLMGGFGTDSYLDADYALGDDFGDLTGDGVDDLVLRRNGYTSNERYQIIPGSRTPRTTINVGSTPSIVIADGGTSFALRPAGDLDGNGRPDVAVTTDDGVRIVNVPATAPAAISAAGPFVPGFPTTDAITGNSRTRTAVGVGDIDGDRLPDLAYGAAFLDDDRGVDRGAVFLATRGSDQVPPQLFPRAEIDPDLDSSQVRPKRFAAGSGSGSGTTLRLNLLEAAEVELVYRKAGASAALSTERRALPKGVTETPWDGLGKGVGGVPGEYEISATPIDAAGNRGRTQVLPFEITNGADAPVAATLEWSVSEAGNVPAGVTPPARFAWRPELGGRCGDEGQLQAYIDDWTWDSAAKTIPVNIFAAVFSGDSCTVDLTSPLVENGPTLLTAQQYPWRSLVSVNGAAPVDVTALGVSQYSGLRVPPFRLKPGKNTIAVSLKWEPNRYPAIDESTNAWQTMFKAAGPANGANVLPNGGGLELTAAKTFQRGVALDGNHPLDARRVKVDFDAVLEGSATGGNGLAFSFFDGTGFGSGGSQLIDNTGAGLGFVNGIGKNGTSIALSTFKGSRNPSANFVGIAASTATSTTGYPTWLATADPGKALAGATTHVTITSKDGVVTVALDGVERLRRTITLPKQAMWALSASTGNAVQRHVIRNLRVVTA